MGHIGEREWTAEEFKDPVIFADSNLYCRAAAGSEESFLDEALRFWASSQGDVGRLILSFRSKLIDTGGQ
jgi:hypothetical protein